MLWNKNVRTRVCVCVYAAQGHRNLFLGGLMTEVTDNLGRNYFIWSPETVH